MTGLLRHLPLALLLAAALAKGEPAAARAEPRGLFHQGDMNHDGRLSFQEVWHGVERLFAAADTNHDGALSLEEWLAARLPTRPPLQNRPAPDPKRLQDRRTAMYRALDSNRENRVTLAELRPVAEAWFRAFDADADGLLTPEELPHSRR